MIAVKNNDELHTLYGRLTCVRHDLFSKEVHPEVGNLEDFDESVIRSPVVVVIKTV